ncbi:MAG: serine/threonine protein kinase [Myxococcales bacterium]|nr:serine/threonine protein kinase [Myxococcales bacterium]
MSGDPHKVRNLLGSESLIPSQSPLLRERHGGTLAPPDETVDAHDVAPVDARVGTVVDGRYRLDALLGAGGMGRVYRAQHLLLGEPVAVKFLLQEWSNKPELRARFRREAVVLARLRHPGIVSVIDFGELDGELYLVMELLRGFSLESQINAGGNLMPLFRVGAVIDQVLQVLEAAHGQGIVHRDLKPDNIMLLDAGDRTDKVKVLDFGIAALQDDEGQVEKLTQAGQVRGTPQYMAPEQCMGRTTLPATDIYAVGCILYELLTGATAFSGNSPAEVMSAQIYQQPVPIAALRQAPEPVPAGLEALVYRAMSKRPEGRPSARDFRDALGLTLKSQDLLSWQARDAADRARNAGLGRDERALTPARDAVYEGPANVAGPAARVALWGFQPPRAQALRSALATQGVIAYPIQQMAIPPASPDRQPWKALVVPDDEHAVRRTQNIKKDPDFAKIPVLVIDLRESGRGAELIRAGASDVALDKLDDPAVCQKVLRAVRRGR